MGEFVEVGLQRQKEEGEVSRQRRRRHKGEGKAALSSSIKPSMQNYVVQGGTAQSSYAG